MERPQAEIDRPDEETFAFPGSWRRVIHPRRGGIPRPPAAVDEDRVAMVRRWTHEARDFIAAVLDHPESEPELVKEARAYLDGIRTPRGAALVGQLVAMRIHRAAAELADSWFAALGPAFAAQAAAELCEVHVEWLSVSGSTEFRLSYRPARPPLGWRWTWLPAVERLRALLVAIGDDEYRAVVETLAGHRNNAAQRLVVSYLVPTETGWVDECCASPPGEEHEDASARTLLFCALGSADQVTALGPYAKFGWGQWSLDVLATTVEGIGPRIAPMLLDALDVDSGSDARKLVLGVLSRLPTDEAFQIMVDRVEQKYVQPALLEAMSRYPVRALRLLAEAAGGPSKSAALAGRLLAGHLLAEPELTAAVLPDLPEGVRLVVEETSAGLVRVEEAPAESLPRPLADPPWKRPRKAAEPAVITGLRAPEEPGISWAPGEREQWAATEYAHWTVEDWDAAVGRYRSDPYENPGPKPARNVALGWFGRHGAEAARLLVPDAVARPGQSRTAAETALRLVASAEGADAVVRAAWTYGDEAAKAVASLLASDPLDRVPAKMPKIGSWSDPVLLPQVLLRDRTRALPLAAVGHLLTMLALSKPGEVSAGLDVVREVCDPESLAEFGWAVFERWRMAGMPSKDGWALTALGWIGDDETVRRLTPVIRAWPGEGGHRRAVTGLDVLAEIGTEIALMHLNGIARRVRFKALKDRAGEKIQEVADGLGLSPEQLADRLVPGFGLDENGSLVLDYGPRPGIAVGLVDESLEQRLGAVWLNSYPDDRRPHRPATLRFGRLDPVTASEVLADLTELTS